MSIRRRLALLICPDLGSAPAVGTALIVVTVLRPAPVIYQGESHADR
ncbi:hypothetical protein [Roseovarius ramblicola]|uniref:Uncharacterized protein n=1 Tax=Roseovarius ramblicola TaxID=2022336 RepID=A0ABV5HWB7_9RHOB